MLIALEGLPGVGKTTAANLLAPRLRAQLLVESTGSHPFLESVYNDRGRHDLEIELAFLLLHSSAYRRVNRGILSVADFAPAKDLAFANDMLSSTELDLFEATYHRLYQAQRPPEIVLVLALDPADCLERARARGRAYEAELDLSRLERMQAEYGRVLPRLGDVVVEVSLSPEQSPTDVVDRLVAELAALGISGPVARPSG